MTNGNIVKLLSEAGHSLDLCRLKSRGKQKFFLSVYSPSHEFEDIKVEGSTLNLVCKRALKEIGKNQRHFMRKDGGK